MTRFCYNNGQIAINRYNASPLHCIAHFMEMNKSISGSHNLFEQTEKSLEEIKYWSWSELLVALKQCQDLFPIANSSGVLQKCLDSLVGRLTFASETSPSCLSTSSPDSSGFRLSTDTRSTESLKNSFSRATWWFEDLVSLLKPNLVKMLVKTMISQKFDQGVISRFVLYYQKSRFVSATSDEKREIAETIIEILCLLDLIVVPYKSLFGILQVCLNLNISKCCRDSLESMIGSQLDQATLDNLLVPSPTGSSYLYDVNLVLRCVKSFLGKGTCPVPLILLKKVARLIDSYIAEVAPDPRLKPSKFLALVNILPDSARDCYDGLYHAMDMYFQVHMGLTEEVKMRVCCGLNYEKLSSETCNHLAHNKNFPPNSATLALLSQHSKLESLLQDTNSQTPFLDSPCSSVAADSRDEEGEQIVLYAGKLNLTNENEKLKAHLQGMQWRVLELEKVCKKMQTQMTKMMKSRLSSQSSARSIPRLCS